MKRLIVLALGVAAWAGAGVPAASAKSYVFPHVLEKAGRIQNTPFTFDTEIHAVYVPREPRDPTHGQATGRVHEPIRIRLFLYEDDDATMRSATGEEICNPCEFELSPAAKKLSIRIDDLIVAHGGFPPPGAGAQVITGYAIMTVSNDDANIAIQGFVVNSHSGPFDLSVFGFEPQEIKAAP
jgi:hypothetical protein